MYTMPQTEIIASRAGEARAEPASPAQQPGKWDHARSNGRMIAPPVPAAYLVVRSPFARSDRASVISGGDFYAGLRAVSGAVAYCMAQPPADPEVVARAQQRRPALGWPRLRWRVQSPVVRVPRGGHLMFESDYAHQKKALADGVRHGLRDVPL